MRFRIPAMLALVATSTLLATTGIAGASTGSTQRHLTSIWFSTPTDGYGAVTRSIVSTTGNSATCTDFIGRTTDGGHHFSDFTTIHTWNCMNAEDAANLVFDGVGDGFFYGPNLYETHNNGDTWTRVAVTGQVVTISPVGRSTWMVEAMCTPKDLAGDLLCPLRMQQSSNGGRTWSATRNLPGYSYMRADSINPSAQGQTVLARLGPQSAMYSVEPFITGNFRSRRIPTWVTNNAGRSWMRRDIVCAIPAMTDMLAVTPSGALVVVCAGEASAGSQEKSVVRSMNEGLSWTTMSQCPTPLSSCRGPLIIGYLGALVAPSDSLVVESGLRSGLNVSHDGGRTWSSTYGITWNNGDGVTSLQFFNSQEGVGMASSSNLIVDTVDGGTHWKTFRARVG